MGHRVFVGASAAATLPAALSAAVLVSAPFSGTSVSPLADSHDVGSSTLVADATPVGSSTPSGPGVAEWALLAAAETVVLAGAVGTIMLARRSRADEG
jgi:hypothetical protein